MERVRKKGRVRRRRNQNYMIKNWRTETERGTPKNAKEE